VDAPPPPLGVLQLVAAKDRRQEIGSGRRVASIRLSRSQVLLVWSGSGSARLRFGSALVLARLRLPCFGLVSATIAVDLLVFCWHFIVTCLRRF
jgi:hypothetical protein